MILLHWDIAMRPSICMYIYVMYVEGYCMYPNGLYTITTEPSQRTFRFFTFGRTIDYGLRMMRFEGQGHSQISILFLVDRITAETPNRPCSNVHTWQGIRNGLWSEDEAY